MSAELIELLADLSRPIPGVCFKRMFGGVGAFCDGMMFAIIHDDRLFLKVDDETRPAFEAEDLPAFSYPMKSGEIAVMHGYRLAPERLFDDPDAYVDWARAAIGVAVRAAARRPKSRRQTAQA